jgi:hypothetical protein
VDRGRRPAHRVWRRLIRRSLDDGTEDEFGPGDLMICPPGHDAWTVGDEACVVVDWTGFGDYAKR